MDKINSSPDFSTLNRMDDDDGDNRNTDINNNTNIIVSNNNNNNNSNKKNKKPTISEVDLQERTNVLLQLLEHDGLSNQYHEKDALRFLRERNYNVDKAFTLIKNDSKWRDGLNIKQINAANIYEQLKIQKFIFPGTRDKKGRPIIIFNAHLHSPKSDFLDTLKLAIYAIELAISHLGESEDVTIIENLSHFTKENADHRMVKFLLECAMNHYPGRIGKFIAVNAPWYYRLLYKLVQPWLSEELSSKVSIFGGVEGLKEYVDDDQLTEELGGSLKFNFDMWVNNRFAIEGVSLNNPNDLVHVVSSDIAAAFSDRPVKDVVPNSTFSGWMKKEGGYVKKFNKRFCVIQDKILFYYKSQGDDKAEGFVPLTNATLTYLPNFTFNIITSDDKHCVFRAHAEHYDAWIMHIKSTIHKSSHHSCNRKHLTKSVDLSSNTSSW